LRAWIVEEIEQVAASVHGSLQGHACQHVAVTAPGRIVVTNVDISGDVRAMMVAV
jgi:hypothetical protein